MILYKILTWDMKFSQKTVGLLVFGYAENPEDPNFALALSDMWH